MHWVGASWAKQLGGTDGSPWVFAKKKMVKRRERDNKSKRSEGHCREATARGRFRKTGKGATGSGEGGNDMGGGAEVLVGDAHTRRGRRGSRRGASATAAAGPSPAERRTPLGLIGREEREGGEFSGQCGALSNLPVGVRARHPPSCIQRGGRVFAVGLASTVGVLFPARNFRSNFPLQFSVVILYLIIYVVLFRKTCAVWGKGFLQ